MAISQIMSNPSDWLSQPYQTDFSVVSQAEALPTVTSSAAAATSRNNNNNLSPDQGRVSKPLRRRARASRRTPTTLLSTDTANFRAMVQHFTGGGPNAAVPFAARQQLPNGGPALNFNASQHMIATTNAAAAPAGGFRVQYPSNQQQQQHNMFMIDQNMHGGGGGGGGLSPQAAAAAAAAARGSSASANQNYNNYMF